MKPENVLLKQQGRSGIKVGIVDISFRSLCLSVSLNPVKPIVGPALAIGQAKTKAEEITFIRCPPEFRA